MFNLKYNPNYSTCTPSCTEQNQLQYWIPAGISHIKWRAESEGVWEHGCTETLQTKEGCSNRRMEEVAQWVASYFVLISKYHYADQSKENKVSRACGTRGRVEESVQGFGGKAWWKDGIRKDLRETGWGVWSRSSWLRIGASGGLL
jgi:hypothetical protein